MLDNRRADDSVHCICGNTLTTPAPDDITLGLTVTCDECEKEWKVVQEYNPGRRRQRYAFEWSPDEHDETSLISIQITLPFRLQNSAPKSS